MVLLPLDPPLFTFLFFFSDSRYHRHLHSFPTRRSSDLNISQRSEPPARLIRLASIATTMHCSPSGRSEEHTSELLSHLNLVCRLLLEKKKKTTVNIKHDIFLRMYEVD